MGYRAHQLKPKTPTYVNVEVHVCSCIYMGFILENSQQHTC